MEEDLRPSLCRARLSEWTLLGEQTQLGAGSRATRRMKSVGVRVHKRGACAQAGKQAHRQVRRLAHGQARTSWVARGHDAGAVYTALRQRIR